MINYVSLDLKLIYLIRKLNIYIYIYSYVYKRNDKIITHNIY